MRFNIRKALSGLLITSLLITLVSGLGMTPITSHAKTKQEIEKEKEKIKEEQEQKKSELEDLNTAKDNLEDEIAALDSKITISVEKINDLTSEKNKIESQMSVTELKLQSAYVAEASQYEGMKERIQYAYENNDIEYIDALLAAKDFDKVNNTSEYVSKVSDYDQAQINSLIQIESEIAAYQEELESNLTKVSELKKDAEDEQKVLEDNMSAKQGKVAEYTGMINDTEADLAELYAAEEAAEKELQAIAAAVPAYVPVTQTVTIEVPVTTTVTNTNASATDATPQTTTTTVTQTVTTTTGYSGGGMIWPMPASHMISSNFGYRTAPTAGATSYHRGVDIACPHGSTVIAAASGVVYSVGYRGAMGNVVMINHGNGVVTVYEHLSAFACSVGQEVQAGQAIAYAGSTGVSTGPHLHFGVMINGNYVNPLGYV